MVCVCVCAHECLSVPVQQRFNVIFVSADNSNSLIQLPELSADDENLTDVWDGAVLREEIISGKFLLNHRYLLIIIICEPPSIEMQSFIFFIGKTESLSP